MESLQHQLEAASSGLFYLSESESPFNFVVFEVNHDSLENHLLQALQASSEMTIDTVSLDDFFRNMVKKDPDASERQHAYAERFLHLQEELHRLLPGVTVYRMGNRQIDAFILGRIDTGSYAGLHTKLVETG